MVGLALLFGSAQAMSSLQYYQGTFLIQDGALFLPVSTQIEEPVQNYERFRRGDLYAVWDKRGLSIRTGNWIYDTKFREIATTPKLFSKPTIHAILVSVGKGDRSLEASSLSGALRLGTDVFFLPRWIDRSGRTWLEALVKVDLSAAKPKPVLLGRFEGVSLASGALDHRLFPLHEAPAVIVRKGTDWGIASYDPLGEEFRFERVGERLRSYSILDERSAAYVEAEDGGLNRAGVADLESGSRNDVLEDRGNIRILDTERPLCAIVVTPERTTLRNLQTGAAVDLPAGTVVRRTGLGVLAWWPGVAPRHAVLLDPSRWEGLADWQGEVLAAPATKPIEVEKTPETKPPAVSKEKKASPSKRKKKRLPPPVVSVKSKPKG